MVISILSLPSGFLGVSQIDHDQTFYPCLPVFVHSEILVHDQVNTTNRVSCLSSDMEKSIPSETACSDQSPLEATQLQNNIPQSKDETLKTMAEEKAAGGDVPEEKEDYPHGFSLTVIVTALCLSVFLVALVCP